MNKMSVIGKVKKITEIQEKGTFRFRKLIVETSDKYPQVVAVDFTQNNCGLLDVWKVGDAVEVFFNVRGREWTNKDGNVLYFTTLNGWKVREYQEVTAQDQAPYREDDLPF
jgi:single-strand DNA-binding protein